MDASSYIWAGTEGAVAAISYGNAPAALDTSQLGQLWFYANTGSDTFVLIEAVAAGLVLGRLWLTAGSGFDWRSLDFPRARQQVPSSRCDSRR